MAATGSKKWLLGFAHVKKEKINLKISFEYALLSGADEAWIIWIFDVLTDGMIREIDAAEASGIPRRWFFQKKWGAVMGTRP